jgi:iron complex outermembrane receptor protein
LLNLVTGLSVSLDYFSINIGNAIDTPPAQTILDQCYSGFSQACSSITRGANNLITQLRIAPLNIQSTTTSGLDFAANYHGALDKWVSGWVGDLTLSALATYTRDYTINLLGSAVQYAGTNGDGAFADPKWRGSFTGSYGLRGFSGFLTERLIGSGVISNKTPIIVNNYVPAVIYFDAGASYAFENGLEIFGVVENIFNKAPPASPQVTTAPHLNLGVNDYVYDVIGTRERVGFRYRF